MEHAFLRELAGNPQDHVTRTVYADWLEENQPELAEAKARFLRVTVALGQLPVGDDGRPVLEQRLRDLAAALPKEWLAVVSCLPVENCFARDKTLEEYRHESPFYFVCDRRWEEMSAADSDTVRFCESCQKGVYFCESIQEAKTHAFAGHCVALTLDLERKQGDLETRVTAGVIDPDYWGRERNEELG